MRPPVVFVHGLRSYPSAWNDMIGWLKHKTGTNKILSYKKAVQKISKNWIKWPINRSNYKSTHEGGFHTNDNKVLKSIQQPLNELRTQEPHVAVEQADVVGHSMGGLLARRVAGDVVSIAGNSIPPEASEWRIYTEARNFAHKNDVKLGRSKQNLLIDSLLVPSLKQKANANEGIVNRLVTIDSPHLGSELANVIIEARTPDRRVRGEYVLRSFWDDSKCEPIILFYFNVSGKAYDDLNPKSFSLRILPRINKKISHIFLGSYRSQKDFKKSNSYLNLFNSLPISCMNVCMHYKNSMFPGDGVVHKSSQNPLQKSPISTKVVSVFNKQQGRVYHTGVIQNHYVGNGLFSLLNTLPQTNKFGSIKSNLSKSSRQFQIPPNLSPQPDDYMFRPYVSSP